MASPPEHDRWFAGARVGQYVLQSQLARGGMGEVWLARQPSLGRLVVLKRPPLSDEDEIGSMFVDEARVVAEPLPEAPQPQQTVAKPVATAATGRAATGRLTLETEPWTQVYEGKRLLGDTPLLEFTLAAGKHRLQLVNEAERVNTTIDLTVQPNQMTVKKISVF